MQAQDRLKSDQSRKEDEQPAVFIGHGKPMVAIEYDDWSEHLTAFVERYPTPVGIVVMSAHWETDNKISITASEYPEQIYDFEGYPDTLYYLTYPCMGDPELAQEISERLSDLPIRVELDETRGLDHGTWVPLYVAYPNAEVPVVQISIPRDANPKLLFDMGTALSPLRKKGILIVGSGNIAQNLSNSNEDKYAEVDPNIATSDTWFETAVSGFDLKSLFDYRNNMPGKGKSVEHSHIAPAFFVLGARTQKDHFVSIHIGFHYSTISMRTFAFTKNR